MHEGFLSPAAFLAHQCKRRSSASKNLKNHRKAWEIPGRDGKSRESMGNPGKAWEILGKHWKSRDSMRNPGKAWKIPGSQEIPG